MEKRDICNNFKALFYHLVITEQGTKTEISKKIGYTSTRQTNKVLNGEMLPSTNAIMNLCNEYNVNPNYILTGTKPFILGGEEEDKERVKRIVKARKKKKKKKIKRIIIEFD